jgi:hypothetical protein
MKRTSTRADSLLGRFTYETNFWNWLCNAKEER